MSLPSPFTFGHDWLGFTVPKTTVKDVQTVVGGEWKQMDKGFNGYQEGWIQMGVLRGIGRMGTKAKRAPHEVHFVLTGGIISAISMGQLKEILVWGFGHGGHTTRLDLAFDDRASLMSVSAIVTEAQAGKLVSRARECRSIEGWHNDTGEKKGATFYLGSRHSGTYLRVYDKRHLHKARMDRDWEHWGVRWELELKDERADAMAHELIALDEGHWRRRAVEVLRAHVNFRETTREASPNERSRAPLCAWWVELTDGFGRAPLTLEKRVRTIEQVKDWIAKSVGPMLAVAYTHPSGGQDFLNKVIWAGADRWKDRHVQLWRSGRDQKRMVLPP